MHTLNFYTIPVRPSGPINPAEVPLAKAILTTSQVDLIPDPLYPTLYHRLVDLYKPFAEEFWVLLFEGLPPAAECLVLPLTAVA